MAVFLVGVLTSITLAQIALALLAVRLVYRIAAGEARLGGAPLAVPFSVWAVVSITAALLAAHPSASLTSAIRGFFQIVTLYVMLDALDPIRADRVVGVLLGLTGVVSAIAIVQVAFCTQLAPLAVIPGLHRFATGCHRAHAFYSIYMTLAGVLTLVLLATLPRVCLRAGSRGDWVAVIAWGTGGVALALTQTRGAWLGFLAGVLVLLLLWRPGRLAIAVGVIGLVVIALALPGVRSRVLSIADRADATASERWAMWEGAIGIARDHPLIGVGPGQVKSVYLQYVPGSPRRARSHVHNTPLQILAERGALGLAAWSAIYLAFFWTAARIRRAVSEEAPAALVVGSMAAVTGFLVGGLTEYNFGDSEVALVAYTIMALPFAVSRPPSPPRTGAEG